MDSFEKFKQKELPSKEDFHSILADQHISDDEYDHAKKFGAHSNVKQWVTTMTCTLGVMYFC